MWIHCHDRAILVGECFFGCNLQINVNGELQLLARLGRFFLKGLTNFAAMAIDQNLSRAILAHKDAVVFELDTRFADHISRVIKLKLRLVQHVFADLAHITDQVCHEPL